MVVLKCVGVKLEAVFQRTWPIRLHPGMSGSRGLDGRPGVCIGDVSPGDHSSAGPSTMLGKPLTCNFENAEWVDKMSSESVSTKVNMKRVGVIVTLEMHLSHIREPSCICGSGRLKELVYAPSSYGRFGFSS